MGIRMSSILFFLSFIFLALVPSQSEANPSYLSFQRLQLEHNSDIYGITYGSKTGSFVVVGDNGYIGVSFDGATWQTANSRTEADLRAVTYRYSALSSDLYVAVGSMGTILTSSNGIQWYEKVKKTDKTLKGVANRNALFVAVGQGGVILRSEGGTNWELMDSPVQSDLNAVAYGSGIFTAVGNQGVIIVSEDGASWRQLPSPVKYNLRAVAFGNGVFTAVGDGGAILRSIDGAVWVQQDSRTGSYLRALTFGDSLFLAAGQNGTVLYSNDATTWIALNTGSNTTLNAVAYRNNIFVSAGFEGAVIKANNNYLITNPSIINFGYLQPNGTFTQPFTVINVSDVPLEISSVTKTGDAQFSIGNDLCTGVVLHKSGSCRIDVKFVSDVAGLNRASIVIKSSTMAVATTISISATSTGVLYSLNVSKAGAGSGDIYSSPNGIACGTACSSSMLGGNNVTLYAIPQTGSSFVEWSGIAGCTNNNPCTFVLNSDIAVSAKFE